MTNNSGENILQLIENALLKKATGFTCVEITNEYQCTDGEQVLVRKKEVIKDVPPDVSAAKILLDKSEVSASAYGSMSDEELKQEKRRLVELLTENKNRSGNDRGR